MRRPILSVLCCVAVAAAAWGDIVYMKDGSVHRGEVTEEGERVLIKKALATIAVDKKDVEKIAKSEASSQAAPDRPFVPTVTLDVPKTGPDTYTHPESHVFLLMRQVIAMGGAGAAGLDLQEKIKQWQAKAHDGDRRVGIRWMARKDCERARAEFDSALKKGNDLINRIRRAGSTTAEARAEQVRLRRSLAAVYRQAAAEWPDEVLGDFLTGLSHLEGINYTGAEQMLRKCIAAAPRVAAFHQGLATALAGKGQHPEALAAYLDALHLQPDSRDSVQMLQDALEQTPGKLMTDPWYVLAKEILSIYELPPKSAYRSLGTTWLMPGRPWQAREDTMPTPPYERLVFLQAVGAPVSKNALLVDRAALGEALEAFVLVDSKTLIPARVQRYSTYSTGGQKPPPVDLLFVDDLEFTPLKTDAAAAAGKGLAVTAYAINLYEEMGSEVRPVPAAVEEADGALTLSQKLVPGETSAPVITKDGVLAGVLAGRTDAMAEGGGDHRFVPVSEMQTLLRRLSWGGSSGGFSRVKRKITPKPAPGQYFPVLITAAEGGDKRRY